MAQRPISSIVRRQPRHKLLFWSSLQMPMQGDITRRTADVGDDVMVPSGFLAEFRELALQLVELALQVVDGRVA